MEEIKTILENILNNKNQNLKENIKEPHVLIEEDEAFLSEADFQLNLARCLDETKDIDNVILEYPFKSIEVYGKNSIYWLKKRETDEKKKDDKTYVDIKFTYKEIDYFIELKYKTDECDVKRYGTTFTLKPQGANNNGRYDIYEDIERIEHIVNKKSGNNEKHGFVIVITNDGNYWKPHDGNTENFLLLDKSNTNNECKFIEDKEKCENCCYEENCPKNKDTHYLGFLSETKKYQKRPLEIENKYSIDWKDWNNRKNFQYLIIEIPKK